MQLKRLVKATLKFADRTKQANGTYLTTLTEIGNYKVIMQELTDEISANIYGANLNKMSRLSSPNTRLEKYLRTKVNNEVDNISKYFIIIDGTEYKIVSVKNNWIDIEA